MRSVAMMVVPFLPSAAAEQQKKNNKKEKEDRIWWKPKTADIHPHPIPASSRKRYCSHQ
jgi:hypothetical protein